MPKVLPSEDIRSLSDFRAHASSFVQQIRQTKRPLILTQHGRSAAVLLDVEEYEALVDQIDLLRDIRTAETQIARGEGVAHTKARAEVIARLRK